MVLDKCDNQHTEYICDYGELQALPVVTDWSRSRKKSEIAAYYRIIFLRVLDVWRPRSNLIDNVGLLNK